MIVTCFMKRHVPIFPLLFLVLLAAAAGCGPGADQEYDGIVGLIDAGRYDEAIKKLDQAVERHPRDPRFYYERGYCRLKNDINAAREDFTKSMEVDPRYFNAYYGLSIIYRKEKKFHLAEEHLLKAIELAPNNERKSAFYGGLALLYGNKRDYQKAIEYCNKSIELDDKGEFYYRLGIFYYNSGQRKKALDTWLLAVKGKEFRQKEFKHLTYNELAQYFYRTGNFTGAKENILKALELDPANKEYLAFSKKVK